MSEKKMYVIGGWDYPWNDGGVKGVHFYENGKMVKTLLPDCNVGTQVYDPVSKIDYICEETSGTAPFGKGTGGYIIHCTPEMEKPEEVIVQFDKKMGGNAKKNVGTQGVKMDSLSYKDGEKSEAASNGGH